MGVCPGPQGCCGGCAATICLTACSSESPVSGITVTVKQGSTTVATAVTAASGCATVPIPSAGTYTVSLSGAGIDVSNSQNVTLSCGGSAQISLSAELINALNAFCCGDCLYGNGTATWTDNNGTIPLTQTVGAGGGWFGCSVAEGQTILVPPDGECSCEGTSTGDVPYFVEVSCDTSTNQLSCTITWNVFLCGDPTTQTTQTFLTNLLAADGGWAPSGTPGCTTPPFTCSVPIEPQEGVAITGGFSAGAVSTAVSTDCDGMATFTLPSIGGLQGFSTVNPAGTSGVFTYTAP
jgi:Carboxypeptidase regulatory-like domain